MSSVGDAIIVLLSAGEAPDTVDQALAEIGLAAGDSASQQPSVAGTDPFTQPQNSGSPESEPALTGSAAQNGHRRFVSPVVRWLASQKGVSIADLKGTGPDGRVVRRDLERHLEQTPVADQDPTPSTAATPAPAELTAVKTRSAAPQHPAPAPSGTTSYEDIPLDRMRQAIARRLTESKSTVPHFYLTAYCRVDALLDLRRHGE